MKHTTLAHLSLAAIVGTLTFACSETAPKPRPGSGNPVAPPESPAGQVNQIRDNSLQNPANNPQTNNPQTLEPAANVPKVAKDVSPGTTVQAPGVSTGSTTTPPETIAPPPSTVVDPNAPKVITAKVTTVIIGTGTESSKYCTLVKNTKITLKGAPVANPGSGGQVIIDFQPVPGCKPAPDNVDLVHATVVKSEFDGW